uniref:Uncharacterized protein n=1 Tax=Amphimedon queenslandica TaxID=400682 RepID=A0A1X7U2F1_AMPQE
EVHVPVSKELLMDFASMRVSYGKMFYNVGKIIKRKSPPLEEIKECLSCYGNVSNVKKCLNISSVLRLIQNECSLTNIALLHSVVEELNITEAEEHIKTYKAELKEFCKSLSISLRLKERFASIPHLQCQGVTFLLSRMPERHILDDIENILRELVQDEKKNIWMQVITPVTVEPVMEEISAKVSNSILGNCRISNILHL